MRKQDDNIWLALQKIEADQHQASPSSVTLQVITMDPPTLMFYSMESIRVLRSIYKEDIMYIDATDSVLLGQSHCYVYEVVVRHPMERNPPLAVASMITWAHDIPSIAHFLQRVWHAQNKQGSPRFYPRLVMCDGSMALINAIVTTIFNESLEGYFRRRWEIVHCMRESSFVSEPFLHLCASHFYEIGEETRKKHISVVGTIRSVK